MSTATSAVQRRQARLSRLPATGHAVGLAILIALSSFLFFFELGRPNLLLWDESRLAVNALEMAQSGNYLVTTYDGAPDTWNSKPPLAIWLMSLSVSLLGASEVSVRLPAALSGFFTMLLLYVFSRSAMRNRLAGLTAGFVLVTSTGYVAEHVTRTSDYDGILVLFITAYVLAFFLWIEGQDAWRRRYLAIFTGCLCLAVLTKGVAGLMPMPGLALWIAVRGKLGLALRRGEVYLALVVLVSAASVYYLLRESFNPGYIDAVMRNEILSGFQVIEGHSGSPLFYVEYLTVKLVPWVYLIPAAVAYLTLTGNRTERLLCLYLMTCALSYLAVISSASTKLPWYDAPLYPLAAVILGHAMAKLLEDIRDGVTGTAATAAAPLLLGAILVLPAWNIIYGISSAHGVIYEWSRDWNPSGRYWHHQQMYGQYLRDVLREHRDIGRVLIADSADDAHLKFYTMILSDARRDLVRARDGEPYASGDVVVSCDRRIIQAIRKTYRAAVIDNASPVCRTLRIDAAS